MIATSVLELVPVLQTAIGPVILISGVGLLLLTMTNRLGRVIDRSRSLRHDLRGTPAGEQPRILAEIAILVRRAGLLRRAITLASISVLLAALLISTLFFTALLRLDDAWLVATLFVGCMAALIGSLFEFIRDLNQSLAALRLELEIVDEPPPRR
jgi:hypothetical protein